jgi:SAM-dependent methyltransferase
MDFPGKKLIPFWLAQKLRGAWQKYLAVKYIGNKYYCPYCDNTFRKMLPGGHSYPVLTEKQIIGGGYRKNLVCPRCFSIDRDRLIYLFFKEKTVIFSSPMTLLHIAPEGCLRSLLMRLPNINYKAGVKYYEGYYYDRKVRIMDLTSLPFDNELFDVVICNHVLEHVQDDKKALDEIYRVLKPGGWAILQVPISKILSSTYEDPEVKSPQERIDAYGQFDHVRIYGQDYTSRLEKHGFTVKSFSPYIESKIQNIDIYALNPEEDLFVAYK